MGQGDGGGMPRRGHPYEGLTPGVSSATAVREGDRVSAAGGLVFRPASKYKALYFVKCALVSGCFATGLTVLRAKRAPPGWYVTVGSIRRWL